MVKDLLSSFGPGSGFSEIQREKSNEIRRVEHWFSNLRKYLICTTYWSIVHAMHNGSYNQVATPRKNC